MNNFFFFFSFLFLIFFFFSFHIKKYGISYKIIFKQNNFGFKNLKKRSRNRKKII